MSLYNYSEEDYAQWVSAVKDNKNFDWRRGALVLKIIDRKKGRMVTVGHFTMGIFSKPCKDKHLMKKFNAYAIQEEAIDMLKKMDCTIIEVHRKDLGKKYVATFGEWLAPDIKVADYGHGKQRFMPVNRMKEVDL